MDLKDFIIERWRIALKKREGKPWPWTADPILQNYSFTNIHREWDRTTIWIRDNWREPYREHDNIITAMTLARYINLPETLEIIGFPETWRPREIIRKMYAISGRVFSPAYIISTNGISMNKIDYVIDLVDRVHRQKFKLDRYYSLASMGMVLQDVKGVGTFMAGQIVADLKFTPMLIGANDWYTWCLPGPGSQRGLNYVFGFDVNKSWNQKDFMVAVNDLRGQIILPKEIQPLSAQDMQNCLCEYSKYRKALLGRFPKRLYYLLKDSSQDKLI